MAACCVTLVKKMLIYPHVNSAFFDFASLASEHSDPDTAIDKVLYIIQDKKKSRICIEFKMPALAGILFGQSCAETDADPKPISPVP
jgi:hypothetical protein